MLLVTSPVSQLTPREFRGDIRTALKYTGQFVTYWLVLFGASSVIVGGDFGWVRETWGARFVFHDEVETRIVNSPTATVLPSRI